MATLREQLLGVLEDLGEEDLKKFHWFLQDPEIMSPFKAIPKCNLGKADRLDTVDLMVQTYGKNTLEVTKKVLSKMNKNDLVQRLSGTSSGTEGENGGIGKKLADFGRKAQEKWRRASSWLHAITRIFIYSCQKIAWLLFEWRIVCIFFSQGPKMATLKEQLLGVLEDLGKEDLNKFKWFLKDAEIMSPSPAIPKSKLEKANRLVTVDLMVQIYGKNTVEVTKKVLSKMNKNDLVQRLKEKTERGEHSSQLTQFKNS
uniref:Pyrin domain-containing protein n=1 Tax=Myripristis murdjan TaxID=586833 RepID=A0A667XWD8_9TELE